MSVDSLNAERAARWRSVRHLLVIRLDGLGDLLMTTPAIAAIRHTLPEARVTLLTSGAGAQAAPHLPGIDDVLTYQAPWVKAPVATASSPNRPMLRMVKRLAARQFDAAIIFTVCTQSALPAATLCVLAGIPLRLAHCRENPYSLLSDWVAETDVVGDGMRHEVSRQLALVAAVGFKAPSERLQFSFSAQEERNMRATLAAAGAAPDKPYFVIHPGASAPSRRYPADRFGIAARIIAERSGAQAVFTGDVSEVALVEAARSAMQAPSISLAGRLPLGELGALIAGARLVLSNNTGPAHLAAALSTPVVDVYALTNPQHTPWQVQSRVLYSDVPCRNCLKSVCPELHHACLRGVSPQRVARAGLDLIGLPSGQRASDASLMLHRSAAGEAHFLS